MFVLIRLHSELLKIYEEGALETLTDKDEDIAKISRLAQPSSSELRRYKLWLDQKYVSPYTGRPIPLAKLFTLPTKLNTLFRRVVISTIRSLIRLFVRPR